MTYTLCKHWFILVIRMTDKIINWLVNIVKQLTHFACSRHTNSHIIAHYRERQGDISWLMAEALSCDRLRPMIHKKDGKQQH